MMHQVLYIVQLPNEEGDTHIIKHLVHHDMPCDPNLVSSAFYTIPIFPFQINFSFTCNIYIMVKVQATCKVSVHQV